MENIRIVLNYTDFTDDEEKMKENKETETCLKELENLEKKEDGKFEILD